MSRMKFPADQGRSYRDIEAIARKVRKAFDLPNDRAFPGVSLFEHLERYSLVTGETRIPLTYGVEVLGLGIEAEARFEDDEGVIAVVLAPATYQGLCDDEPRDRFSFAHELGHAVLHHTILQAISRIPRDQAALMRGAFQTLPNYRDAEWQGDAFAGALLAPAEGLLSLEQEGQLSASRVSDRFRVSSECAKVRVDIYKERRDQLIGAKT